jgi:glycosyltransferase involved in cell wall biosynthesis
MIAGDDPAPVPQRIAIVLPSDGLHDARTTRLARDLARRGHTVTIVARASSAAPAGESALEGPEPGGTPIRVVRVDTGTRPGGRRGDARGLPSPLREARRLLGVAGGARRQASAVKALRLQVDLVHAMGFLALPPARAIAGPAGTPLVYDARDLYLESTNLARLPGPVRWAFAAAERRWGRQAARVFTVNESLADHLEQRYRIPRPVVVMNGQRAWPEPPIRPDLLRERLRLGPDRRIALYHGGFMPDRGIPELIAAVALPELADVDLVLMGYGGIEARVRSLAAASPASARVHVIPPVSPDELLDWVASADVGVMPNQPRTLNERLSTPNKLFECLAAGTPVVSSDFPERRRVLTSDPAGPLGALCDPTDPVSIAAGIRSILDLPPVEAVSMRARCRDAAQSRYGWEQQAAGALAAYSQITGSPW